MWFRAEKRIANKQDGPGYRSSIARQSGRISSVRVLLILIIILAIGGGIFIGYESGLSLLDEPEPAYDGYRYEAVGDSITFGVKLRFDVDESHRPIRTMALYQGWPELLGEMLTRQSGINTAVFNEGHPGDRSSRLREERIPAMFEKRRRADAALLLIGTINSSAFHSTPSGMGCKGSACKGTLKGDLLKVISKLQNHGRESVRVALIPPVWGPEDAALYTDALAPRAKRNQLVKEYNRMIEREIAILPGVKLGPDFFTCFLTPDVNRFSLFQDHLHPNALGNLVMATLWFEAIVNDSVVPGADQCPLSVYILESLNPLLHGHKQNLLTEGDAYYVDEEYTLTSIPDELASGIWVLQANADRVNRDASYLDFEAGAQPVTVYIAYDPAGDPPSSASHQFTPYSLSADLTVSDPLVGTFAIVRADNVTGMVRIGGNKSGANPAPQQGYIVIVVP